MVIVAFVIITLVGETTKLITRETISKIDIENPTDLSTVIQLGNNNLMFSLRFQNSNLQTNFTNYFTPYYIEYGYDFSNSSYVYKNKVLME